MNSSRSLLLLSTVVLLTTGCVSLSTGSATEWANEDTSQSFVAGGQEFDSSQCQGAVKNETCYGAIVQKAKL